MHLNKGKTTSRVLIADDDPVIRHWLTSILAADGYQVVSTSDGRDAYRLLQGDADFVGAVFDMSMPFLEGSDLIKFMRTEKRLMRIPVMLITAESDIRLVANGFASGATVLLPKPFTRKRLQVTLRMMLGPAAVSSPTSLPTATHKGLTLLSAEKSVARLPNVDTTTEAEDQVARHAAAGPVDLSILIEDEDIEANLVVELIDLYLENASRQVREINAAATQKADHKIRELAHALKGSSLTIGVGDVAQVCAELEQENTRKTGGVTELANKLEAAFMRAGEILKGERQKRATPVAA
jgi:DNA-binding response OmpR family regulator/HPt (histidine-containing phosphotransfer) domain-containing protein